MLKVENLTFSFKNRPLFTNLSFNVKSGSLVRIAGPNGSGKSTLLALITGLISGAKGSIEFEGSRDFRSWTSWMAADANGLITSLSATANLQFWLELRHPSFNRDRIAAALSDWGLTGEWIQSRLPVTRFSTGMRRRLSLARLELEGSKLWLLDEPLFGLDESACHKFRMALQRHLTNGGAAIVVTHDERLVEGLNPVTIMLGERAS